MSIPTDSSTGACIHDKDGDCGLCKAMEERETAMIKDRIAEHERAAANLRAALVRREHRAANVEGDADKRAHGGDLESDE